MNSISPPGVEAGASARSKQPADAATTAVLGPALPWCVAEADPPTASATPVPEFSISVDTMRVGFPIPESHIDFFGWRESAPYRPDGAERMPGPRYIWKRFHATSGTELDLKYVPKGYKGEPLSLLLAEFSLPYLVHGDNYRPIKNYETAIDAANAELARIPGLPVLGDIRTATLHRLDLNANFLLGSQAAVSDYLQAISRAHHPHRKPIVHKDESVTFPYADGSTGFYDKFKQTHGKAPAGFMKMEIQARDKREVGQLLGKPSATPPDFSLRIIAERLLDQLRVLKLDKPILSDELEVERRLSAVYSSKARVEKLLGYWLLRQSWTFEQMIAHNWTADRLNYCERLLAKAGLSSLSSDSTVILKTLTEFFPDLGEFSTKPLVLLGVGSLSTSKA